MSSASSIRPCIDRTSSVRFTYKIYSTLPRETYLLSHPLLTLSPDRFVTPPPTTEVASTSTSRCSGCCRSTTRRSTSVSFSTTSPRRPRPLPTALSRRRHRRSPLRPPRYRRGGRVSDRFRRRSRKRTSRRRSSIGSRRPMSTRHGQGRSTNSGSKPGISSTFSFSSADSITGGRRSAGRRLIEFCAGRGRPRPVASTMS